jgi:hypothetical protein
MFYCLQGELVYRKRASLAYMGDKSSQVKPPAPTQQNEEED